MQTYQCNKKLYLFIFRIIEEVCPIWIRLHVSVDEEFPEEEVEDAGGDVVPSVLRKIDALVDGQACNLKMRGYEIYVKHSRAEYKGTLEKKKKGSYHQSASSATLFYKEWLSLNFDNLDICNAPSSK